MSSSQTTSGTVPGRRATSTDGVAATPAASATRRTSRRGGGAAPWLFMAPYLVLFVGFVVAPVIYGLWISLHDYDYTLPGKPSVGVDNYAKLFQSDSVTAGPFWQGMKATAIFTVFSVPLLLAVPLAVALLMNSKFKGRNLFRALYFAPYVLGVAVVASLWRFLLDTNIGLVNQYLGAIGLPDGIPWLTSTPEAWVALIGVTVWWTLGFNAVIYLAGLQDISRELYDAAKVDGAGRWAEFRNVTLPGLRPVLLFVVTTTILASANMFGQSYLITQGAPGNETRTVVSYVVERGLAQNDAGRAAAMSIVLTLMLIVVSIANFRIFRYRED